MIRSGREAGCGDTVLLLLIKVSISPQRIVFISLTLHLHISQFGQECKVVKTVQDCVSTLQRILVF
jgi:hypothetical protein